MPKYRQWLLAGAGLFVLSSVFSIEPPVLVPPSLICPFPSVIDPQDPERPSHRIEYTARLTLVRGSDTEGSGTKGSGTDQVPVEIMDHLLCPPELRLFADSCAEETSKNWGYCLNFVTGKLLNLSSRLQEGAPSLSDILSSVLFTLKKELTRHQKVLAQALLPDDSDSTFSDLSSHFLKFLLEHAIRTTDSLTSLRQEADSITKILFPIFHRRFLQASAPLPLPRLSLRQRTTLQQLQSIIENKEPQPQEP